MWGWIYGNSKPGKESTDQNFNQQLKMKHILFSTFSCFGCTGKYKVTILSIYSLFFRLNQAHSYKKDENLLNVATFQIISSLVRVNHNFLCMNVLCICV